jgi:tetratricopeptide (TPR) repeat protein
MKKAVLLIILFLSFNKIVFSAATSDQYLAAGNTLYQQKNYSKAVLYYKAAIQMDPGNALAYQRLGNTYYLLGQKQDALTAYQHALSINPNNPPLFNFIQALKVQLSSGSMAPAAPRRSYEPVYDTELNAALGLVVGSGAGTGFGPSASIYFKADKDLWLGGSLGIYAFGYSYTTTEFLYYPYGTTQTTSDNESLIAIELLASGKYYFNGQGIRPYLVGGVGVAIGLYSSTVMNSYNPATTPSTTTSYSDTGFDPMLQAGGGLLVPLGDDLNLFGEVKYSLVISSDGSGSYVPINVGVNFGL